MKGRLSTSIILLASAFLMAGFSQGRLTIDHLKCEYRSSPLGIDTPRPRLSWILHSDARGQQQTAYRILVASRQDRLNESGADLWDSGKVESGQSINVVYGGKKLISRQKCYWKVRVWGKEGQASSWSQPARWEMSLLEDKDWSARWIDDGKETPEKEVDLYKDDPAPLFRREFMLEKAVAEARLYITGLGYYEAYLNGKRVGDSVLDPPWTAYAKRIFYSVHDIKRLLQEGRNCIGVTLGNGWYNPLPLRMWGRLNLREHLTVGRPRFIAQLEVTYDDGTKETVDSDETWKVREGPLLRNNIYLGETYDARMEIDMWNRSGCDESGWRPAASAAEKVGKLQVSPLQPVRVTAVLHPESITQPVPGTYIVDMGQNFAGWAQFRFRAPRGTRIRCRYGELLHADGTLNPLTSVCGQIKGTRKNGTGKEVPIGGPGSPETAWQEDIYITKGGGWEEYTPRFTFHAFRYIEISGYPGEISTDMITGLRLNSDVAETGSFSCSNAMFNDIQAMTKRTFLSNLFSVQSDCPHRERFGYGGDIVATQEAMMFNYDMAAFYAKSVKDWSDGALDKGMLTDTAPYVGIQYCGVGWALAHPLLQLNLSRYFGDRRVVENQYAVSRRWLELVRSRYPDYIVPEGLSDHESLTETPPQELVTPLYFFSARVVSELAGLLGRGADKKEYEELSAGIASAYLKKFWQEDSGLLAPGTQTSQAFGLYLGLVPEQHREKSLTVLEKLIADKKGHLTTGILGTPYMLDALSRSGRTDLAYRIVNQRTFPGWGHMLEQGATTLWEHWAFSDNTYSHNHPMFGSVSQWFYNWLGGIQVDAQAVGFDKVIIRPQFIPELQWVKCSYDSVRGKITSNWQRKKESLYLEVHIPVNTSATLYLPALKDGRIFESGRPIEDIENIRLLQKEEGAMIYRIGSGIYNIEIRRRKEGDS